MKKNYNAFTKPLQSFLKTIIILLKNLHNVFFKTIFHLPPTPIKPFSEAGSWVEGRSSTINFYLPPEKIGERGEVEDGNVRWKMHLPPNFPLL